ncbi:MFS transporter [Candidatus Woesearchaeota archaeon]|nr:MFS transporter [Candidatus Woesearchaeota archaeon]
MGFKLESNIWKFYLLRVFSTLVFLIPVYILFLQENGLNLTQIMVINAIYAITTVAFAIPAGVFADVFGRKKSLLLSTILHFSGWVVFSQSYNFVTFLIAEIILALSFVFFAGIDSAFLYDTLLELKREKDYKRIEGNNQFINYSMWGIASLIGGLISKISLRATFYYSLPFLFIACFIPFFFREPKKHESIEKEYIKHIKEAIKISVKHTKVRFFIIYSLILGAIFTATYLLYQPFMNFIGLKTVFFGVVYFFSFLSTAFGAKIAHRYEEFFGKNITLFTLLIIPLLLLFGISITKNLVIGVISIALLGFFGGILWPLILSYINEHVESRYRATVMSVRGFGQGILLSIISPFIGWVGDVYTIQTAMLLSALILVVDLVILILFLTVERGVVIKESLK